MNRRLRTYTLFSHSFLFLLFLLLLSGRAVLAQAPVDSQGDISYGAITQNKQIPTTEGAILEGRDLFMQHCSRCHAMGKQVIGPALASVQDRRPLEWLLRFIPNSQSVISSGDDYATFLFGQYNGYVMPDFEYLEKKDIINILAYIKHESSSESHVGGFNGKAAPTDNVPAEQLPPSRVEPSKESTGPTGSEDFILYGMMAVIVFVLGIVVLKAFGLLGK